LLFLLGRQVYTVYPKAFVEVIGLSSSTMYSEKMPRAKYHAIFHHFNYFSTYVVPLSFYLHYIVSSLRCASQTNLGILTLTTSFGSYRLPTSTRNGFGKLSPSFLFLSVFILSAGARHDTHFSSGVRPRLHVRIAKHQLRNITMSGFDSQSSRPNHNELVNLFGEPISTKPPSRQFDSFSEHPVPRSYFPKTSSKEPLSTNKCANGY